MMTPVDSSAATDETRRAKVNEVWSAELVRDAAALGQYWLAHPMVRDRVNCLASGRIDQDAYGHLMDLLNVRGMRLPIPNALSLGCGFGGLERDLASRGLVSRMHAIDLAEGAIIEARRLAEEAGFGNSIRYEVADLEVADFAPGCVDVIFAHSSVHHVERLEALFAAVKRALRPGGVLHLYEFVGPTRFQWTDAQLRLGNELLDSLPERLRRLPNGEAKGRLTRPTIDQMLAIDPTEAIRSKDILPLIRQHFTVVEERPLGGALLHPVLGDIAQNFRPDDADDCAVLKRFFVVEDAAMADGSIGSDFVTVTAVLDEAPSAHAADPKTDVARTTMAAAPATLLPRPRSILTSLSLALPPVRRLHAALRDTQDKVKQLSAEQDRLSAELAELRQTVADLRRGNRG